MVDFVSISQNFRPFPRLVRSCINADFCVQGVIFERFSSFAFFRTCGTTKKRVCEISQHQCTVRSSVNWSTSFSFSQNFRPFPRLVNGCINADFCVQGVIFQRFSSFTFFPLHQSRILWFFNSFAPFFVRKRKNGRPNYRGSESKRRALVGESSAYLASLSDSSTSCPSSVENLDAESSKFQNENVKY